MVISKDELKEMKCPKCQNAGTLQLFRKLGSDYIYRCSLCGWERKIEE